MISEDNILKALRRGDTKADIRNEFEQQLHNAEVELQKEKEEAAELEKDREKKIDETRDKAVVALLDYFVAVGVIKNTDINDELIEDLSNILKHCRIKPWFFNLESFF